MVRPDKTKTFLRIARELSRRSTCARRQVGCVIVNSFHHIVATGYNGVGRQMAHCIDEPCGGSSFDSKQGLDKCEAIHAEQNALIQCKDVMDVHAAYITCSPCIHCAKLFLNTSIKEIYCLEIYDQEVINLLTSKGIRVWIYSQILLDQD